MVEGLETESLSVQWQCRAYVKDGTVSDKEQPKTVVEGDNLKR